jgi:DNA repair protein RadA/Sms
VSGRAVPSDTVVVGEVGLSGEVRGVSQLGIRLAEVEALGFKRCIVPTRDLERLKNLPADIDLIGALTVSEALERASLNFTRS